MNPRLARRLLGLTVTCLIGYAYGRVEASFGPVPLAVFTLLAAAAWCAGYVWAARQYADTTALANRDRDRAFARIAELEDGQRYEPVPLEDVRRRKAMEKHPSYLSKRGPA